MLWIEALHSLLALHGVGYACSPMQHASSALLKLCMPGS